MPSFGKQHSNILQNVGMLVETEMEGVWISLTTNYSMCYSEIGAWRVRPVTAIQAVTKCH